MTRKNIIIGLDGATWEILDYFAENNVMPTIKNIKKRSIYGKLKSTIVPITPSAWASMLTGCTPPQTGIFDFLKRGDEGDSYSKQIVNGSDIRVPTMWEVLSSYNRDVISINVPMTFPPRPTKGVIITGMMTPINEENFTYPPDLNDELRKHGIEYRLDTELHKNRSKFLSDDDYINDVFKNGAEVFFRDLNELLDIRTKTVNYLMREKKWDYFMFVLIGIDRIQHHLWDYIMDPGLDGKITENIKQYYSKVDELIGTIYQSYQTSANIFMVSDHGFSRLHGTFMIDAWLMGKGYLKINEKKIGRIAQIAKRPLRKLDSRVKDIIRKAIGKEHVNKLNLAAHSIDWSGTVAYGAETNGININLIKRDTCGKVQPDEYEPLREKIISELMNVTYHDGRKIVKNAFRKEEVYKKGDLSLIPDIIIEFHDDFMFQARYSENHTNNMELFTAQKWLSGFHIRDGIFTATGDDVYAGKEIDNIRIEDIFPTILALNNERIPDHLDGRIVSEIMNKDIKADYVNFQYDPDSKKYDYSESGEDDIKEKLKSLGYI